jgi:hypothetical protein
VSDPIRQILELKLMGRRLRAQHSATILFAVFGLIACMIRSQTA